MTDREPPARDGTDLQRLAALTAPDAADPAGDDALGRAVLRVVRRYCRARLGRSGVGYAAADDVAARVAASILRDHRDELAGPRPIEAVIYADMAAAVQEAVGAVPAGRNPWSHTPPGQPVGAAPENADLVLAQLDALPQRAREVLVLRAMVGLSSAQVGRALGLTPEAVSLEQQRALTLLRRS